MRLPAHAAFLVVACPFAIACSKSQPPPPAASAEGGAAPPVASVGAPPSTAIGLSGFEGEIDVTIKEAKSKDPPVAVALLVKNGKARADIPESLARQGGSPFGQGYAIIDPAGKKAVLVNDARRQAFVFSFDKGADAFKNFGGAAHPTAPDAAPSPPATVTKTGHFDTIAGYKCEDWEIKQERRAGTLCVAEQDAPWLHWSADTLSPDQRWVGDLLDGKHVPLRFVGYDKDGAEQGRFEVTKLVPKALDAADFEVPAAYQTIDLQKMMQGMPHPPGMPGMPPQRGAGVAQ